MTRIPLSERRDTAKPVNSTNFAFQGKTAEEAVSGSATFLPNEMNTVEQPSFHWQFYVATDTGSEYDVEPKCMIAQTGKSSLNITSVVIDSKVAPNFQSMNSSQYTFTITIVEPMNMSLPDKMLAACRYANVQNFMKAPYYLRLSFLGYDPETGEPKRPTEDTWTWRILINDLTTDFDNQGARHVITAISFNELGLNNEHALIQTPINIDFSKSEGTVGDILEGIQDQINEAIKKTYNVAGGGVAPFSIKILDKPYSQTINVSRPFLHKVLRDKPQLDNNATQGLAQISSGTDLGRVVDYLMSVSETAVALLNPASSALETDSESTKEYSIHHRLESEVKFVAYDPKTQDYIKEITFWVVGTNNVRSISSAKGADDANAAAQKKLQFMISEKQLMKQYEYLYTGKNTEVLDFNISLKFDFKTALQVMQGFSFTEVASPGVQYAPEEYQKIEKNTDWPQVSDGIVPLNKCVAAPGSTLLPPGTSLLDSLNAPTYADVDTLDYSDLPLPTSFKQDNNKPSIDKTISSTNLRSRSIYGMVLNQLYGSLDQNLNKVDLLIRGDPYWLGTTNTESIVTKSTDRRPNFIQGEHNFLLKFMLPQGIDDEGRPILKITDMFSGYFAVQEVTHKFEEGQFTQSLKAVRIPVMQFSKLQGSQ